MNEMDEPRPLEGELKVWSCFRAATTVLEEFKRHHCNPVLIVYTISSRSQETFAAQAMTKVSSPFNKPMVIELELLKRWCVNLVSVAINVETGQTASISLRRRGGGTD